MRIAGASGSRRVVPYDGEETFKRIGNFLINMLRQEYVGKGITVAGVAAGQAPLALSHQLRAFRESNYPFNGPLFDGMSSMGWWRLLEQNPSSAVLAVRLISNHFSSINQPATSSTVPSSSLR